ncbi:MAG TPA: hypothetical protein ENJ51_01215 [Leucothrix mucor]|uniref:Uncharacterized protein n=1 Tax=Leucothrix mucor TaxID=45248 RepID=A0A7V2SXT7_LEUMU|nr:hypothetical protein [Leucothrix mucor]
MISKLFVLFTLLLLMEGVLACKPVRYIGEFKITQSSSQTPQKPDFILDNIKRGKKIQQRKTSCDWMITRGTLFLKLKTIPKVAQGYIFEIIEGKLEDNSIFKRFAGKPVKIIYPRDEKQMYQFSWLDGNSDSQEAFNINVKITAFSLSGKKSRPQYLTITHKGVNIKKPSPSFWSGLSQSLQR